MRQFATAVTVLLLATSAHAQSMTDSIRKSWSKPLEPFHVIGNIHYVGATGISSHIITTSEGLILVDTGTTLMGPQILENLGKLGHKPTDIRYIISSHAHWDHVEGHAEMKRLTGAEIVALGEDAASIASGVDTSALGGDGWTPVTVDRVIGDGETLALGDTTLTAHLTAGHTKGCTTWTTTVEEDGATYNVVFIGGTSINAGVKLLNNERHSTIAEDYARTFAKLKSLKVDVFLAQHPSMYGMEAKRQTRIAGTRKNPFINPKEYVGFVAEEEAKFRRQLQREREAR